MIESTNGSGARSVRRSETTAAVDTRTGQVPEVEGRTRAGTVAEPATPGWGAEGLSETEAARRLAEAGPPRRPGTSRSYASIVRGNVLTVFNLILAGFGIVTLIFGDPRDALFLGIIVANSGIGITQEVRAKRALERLALLVAPTASVRRDGRAHSLPVEQVVVDDIVTLQPGDQVIADGALLSATDLRVDQSILTGESEPIGHRAGDALLSGHSWSRGRARTA
jgi:cation-transporting ATPase E